MEAMNRLKEHLEEYTAAPFLFLGSGFSRRYLGTEDWKTLLEKFSTFDRRGFRYYSSKADGDLPKAASYIAEEFYDIWWSKDEYQKNRIKYEPHILDKESPLKIEISEYLSNKVINLKQDYLLSEINKIPNIVVDGIITTNWDCLIENLFPEFDVKIGQKGILNGVIQEIGEIYKIHGCSKEPNSLVLTNRNYENFNNKNKYLAAKLLSIFIEHPIIFMGYSISDENIIEILKDVSECLSEDGVKRLNNNFIFIEYDDKIDEPTFISTTWPIGDFQIPILLIKAKDYNFIYDVLCQYQRKISIKHLRQIKGHLYNLIKTNEIDKSINVIGIDESTNIEGADFAIAVGKLEEISKIGYRPPSYDELLEDVVLSNGDFDSKRIINETIGALKTTTPPIFKYLYEGGFYNEVESIPDNVKKKFEKYKDFEEFRVNVVKEQKVKYTNENFSSIEEMRKCKGDNYTLMNFQYLNIEKLEIEDLRRLLYDNLDYLKTKNNVRTYLRKAIRIYDWLQYYYYI